MTATVTPTSVPPRRPRWSRRRRLSLLAAAALAVILALGVAGVLTARHLDGQYGPIEPGMFHGPVNADQLVTGNGLTGSLRPGSSAPVQLMSSLRNNGSHAVTVTTLDYTPFRGAVSDIRWSTFKPVPGGNASGENTPWHSFPATIPDNWTIRLLITVHRPADCASYVRLVGAGTYAGSVVVHWKSLLHDHATSVRADRFDQGLLTGRSPFSRKAFRSPTPAR